MSSRAVEIAGEIRRLEDEKHGMCLRQAELAMEVFRGKLYKQHPNPKARADLFQYLIHAADMPTNGWTSELNAIASIIIPFCERYSIGTVQAMSRKNFGKLREAITALRRACGAKDVARVKAILKDVRNAPNRRWIRLRYRSRRARLGRGYTADLKTGELVCVVYCDPGITSEDVVEKIGYWVDFSLPPGRVELAA